MTAVSVAGEWQLLYNRFYRKLAIYTMQWGRIDLSRHRIAAAPFGGPVAAIRDDSKIVQLYAESARRKLLIFNAAGRALASAIWDRPGGRLVGMAWTDDQVLVCVVQDGTVYRYNIHAELCAPQFSMGKECFEQGVVECVFWGNGMVCITEGFQIFCVPDFKNPVPCKLSDPGIDEYPLCVAVIDPQYTMSGNVEVLLGVGDHVLLVEEDGVQQLGVGVGPFQKMAVSQNGKYLATFTHDGRLLVILTDFSKIIFEYTCESALPPEQISWCGLDSVLLYWDERELLMVGPNGNPVSYLYDEPIRLIPECDGVRILSNSSMEFLQRVPDSTVSIFQVGSTLPAALLYDALEHFDRCSSKADENLRLIRSSLAEAVETCIDAAGHEFDVSRQRTLLRAASYGRAFCSQFPRDHFQEMCKILRVLNAVRNHEIGIPLSIQQYKLLTAPVLIGRLINANHHLVALRISEYLNLNPEVVIMHWACAKITASPAIQDSALLEILLDKVPLLLSIEEDDSALVKAIESGDTDLVYLVLFHIWQKKPALDFFGTINARPLARDLFISYSRYYKHEFLKDFFLSTGRLQDVAFLLLKESWKLEKNPMASKGSPLHGPRIRLIEQAQKLFSETKEHNFESKAAEEHAKLLRLQHDLEVSTKQAIFVDSSISDTIRTCIVLGNHREAMRVRTEFKVSEKRWYWLKAFALATVRDWDALEKFSKEKRPPGGYKPFVEACIDADEKAEAVKYIPKLTEPRERSEAYARIGMAKEAADAASQAKDSELFGRLKLTLAQNAAASSIFDTLRDRLSFQGVY
ncbi:vacuolar protein sorting-associated protein 16 [Musa troglodytarum]|uniref:Protein VACUOLELESS1 n=1 Tax=Musa troglodytarum TaxID=320322 RepID=A0A9E7HFS1_9LILI|nr:vacuolar protein sorting-associated protein 16 [Musa troglodytarum]